MSILIFEMAANVEQRNRIDRQEHDRLLSEAKSLVPARSTVVLAGMRRLSGGTLIRIGARLSGGPVLESGVMTQAAW